MCQYYSFEHLHVCFLRENLLFSTLILGSVIIDYVVFYGDYSKWSSDGLYVNSAVFYCCQWVQDFRTMPLSHGSINEGILFWDCSFVHPHRYRYRVLKGSWHSHWRHQIWGTCPSTYNNLIFSSVLWPMQNLTATLCWWTPSDFCDKSQWLRCWKLLTDILWVVFEMHHLIFSVVGIILLWCTSFILTCVYIYIMQIMLRHVEARNMQIMCTFAAILLIKYVNKLLYFSVCFSSSHWCRFLHVGWVVDDCCSRCS